MDNSPTSTINFDRPTSSPQEEIVVMPENKDPKRTAFRVAVALTAAIVLCFMAVIFIEVAYRVGGSGMPHAPQNGVDYAYVQVSGDDVHKGDLILVKEGYEYVFPSEEETNLVSIQSNKKGSYYVNSKAQAKIEKDVMEHLNGLMATLNAETGFSNLYVNEGYRSFEKQDSYYNNPNISDEVAAGFSEHHLGTCVDLKIYYSDSDKTYELEHKPEIYGWLKANAYRHGFVDRYPDSKVQITGVDHDFATPAPSTHLRYVGYAHAYYMAQNDLCLEEYLTLLSTNYSYEGEHLTFTADDGSAYEVYYFEAEGDQIELPVPKDYEYSISGDNMGGFIVTVCFGKANG